MAVSFHFNTGKEMYTGVALGSAIFLMMFCLFDGTSMLQGVAGEFQKSQSRSVGMALILGVYVLITAVGLLCYQNYRLAKCIGRLKKVERELRFYSYYDSVSGTYNRNAFVQKAKTLESAVANLAVIVCDVDGLKLINDTLGHTAGDQLIRITADILNQVCSSKGVVYRMGGDEFLVLLTKSASSGEFAELIQGIRQAIYAYNEDPGALPLSLSVGWAIPDDEQSNLADLIKTADNRMYQEKSACREKVRQSLTRVLKTMAE